MRQQPTYAAIDSLVRTDTIKSDFASYAVRTQVLRIGGAPTDTLDFKVATVTVSHPGMKKVVVKSTAVAAF